MIKRMMGLAALFAASAPLPVAAEDPQTALPEGADYTETARRLQPALEYAFTIELQLTKAIYMGPSTAGPQRVTIYVKDGRITGPRLSGSVVPMSGGDFASQRADGVIDFDARYVLELSDGTFVYFQNKGYRWGTPAAMEKLKRGEPVADADYYMRVTPRFEVRPGPHDWLAKTVFVGIGEKTPGGNRIHYYMVK